MATAGRGSWPFRSAWFDRRTKTAGTVVERYKTNLRLNDPSGEALYEFLNDPTDPQVTYVGSGALAENASAATTLAVPYPAGIVAGDLLVLWVTQSANSTVNPATPAGWTSIDHATAGGASPGGRVCYKIADGSETGTLNVTTTSTTSKGGMVLLRGVHATQPVADVTAWESSADVTEYPIPPVYTATGGLVLVVAATNNGTASWANINSPGVFTELVDDPSPVPSTQVSYLAWGGPGPMSLTADASTGLRGFAIAVAFRPAGGKVAVGNSRGTTWDTRAAAASTRDTTWNTKAAAANTRATTWDTRATAAGSRSTTWDTRSLTSGSRGSTWNVLAAQQVGNSRNTLWDIRAGVTSTRATTWDTRTAVSRARTTSWDTRAAVAGTRATSWDTRATVARTRSTTWDTRTAVVSARASTWDVRTAVAGARSTTWDVRSLVTSTRASTWDTRGTAAGTRATTWDTRAAVARTRSTTWDVRGTAAGTRSTTWNVLTVNGVGNSRGTLWHTRAAVGRTMSTTWDVRTPVDTTRTTTWRSLTAATGTRSTTWDTAAAVTLTRATSWRTLAPVALTRVTSWHVEGPQPPLDLLPAPPCLTTRVPAMPLLTEVPAMPLLAEVPAMPLIARVPTCRS